MPDVGDNVHLMGFHMSAVPGVVTAVDYGKRTFNVNTDGTERGHSLAFDDVRWNFADPAVEALRLQEAAWRADTSPLPEDLLSAIEETKYSFKRGHERSAEVLHELMFADGGVFNLGEPDLIKISDAARSCMKHVYNLLRWQAQQEGAKHE
jgi:hypothetical protein